MPTLFDPSAETLPIPETGDGSPARLVSIFGDLGEDRRRRVCYVFDAGDPRYRVMSVDGEAPVPSVCRQYPGASWHERELRDQYGIEVAGTPDLRPLLQHENWPSNVHPMLERVSEARWARGPEYRFLKVEGDGVCEVPVGPVHAGIIEPGHFRFSVIGDTVLHLELRLFYTHKGTEKLFEGRRAESASVLAESVSGDNCVAHAVAYCQAVENACGAEIPARAAWVRLIGLEWERLAAHIGDFGALCNDVAFAVPAARCAALKERLLRASADFIGTRYWRGVAVPGGIRVDLCGDLEGFGRIVRDTARQFSELAGKVIEVPSVQNRFDSAGVLKRTVATDLGAVGYVARASGVDLDVRRDHPYGLYQQLAITVPCLHYGDVMARARVREMEAAESARLIAEALRAPVTGPLMAPLEFSGGASGLSAVESPRGELVYFVGLENGWIRRCHVRSPSFQNWPALPFTVVGNVIADFPLINKSFNLSYSGCDR